jgi:signal transduction histidine kinase
MEIQYETEKKELRIASLEKARTFYIWLSIAGSAILLLALGLLFFRHRLNVHKRKLAEQQIIQLEQEKQIIAVQSVLDGETEERKRVAGELHDSLGAMLSVVKLNLADVEHLQNARDLLDQSINELRRIAHRMMPESLLRYGLKASLEDFCLSVPIMEFHYFGDESRLEDKVELLMYRCVHELVNNALKYSGATGINVQLVQGADRLSLTVQDNGCGFEPETPA